MNRIFASGVVVCLVASGLAFGQSKDVPAAEGDNSPRFDLHEDVKPGTQSHNVLDLTIKGRMRVEEKEHGLAGRARLEFNERVLKVADDGSATKVVRLYNDARARFVVGQSDETRVVREGVRLVVGEREAAGLELWSPNGPFVAAEKELIQDVLDVTRLPSLLAPGAVKVGESWDVPADVIVGLFTLDSYISSTIKGTLLKVENDRATIGISGEAQGLSLAAEMKAKVQGEIVFDLPEKRIVGVQWKQEESRAASPIGPAGTYEIQVTVTRTGEKSPLLTDELAASKNLDSKPASKLLVFEDTGKRFKFYHDRNWHLTVNSSEAVVFRKMEGNEFVCQLNVIGLANQGSKSVLTKAEFQAAVAQSGGWKIDQVVDSQDVPTDGTFSLQLLTAAGKTGDIQLIQRHFLATSKLGQQVAFSFVLEPQRESKLGTGDLSLVSTIEFPTTVASQSPATETK